MGNTIINLDTLWSLTASCNNDVYVVFAFPK